MMQQQIKELEQGCPQFNGTPHGLGNLETKFVIASLHPRRLVHAHHVSVIGVLECTRPNPVFSHRCPTLSNLHRLVEYLELPECASVFTMYQ